MVMIVVVMGVSGSGKTEVGTLLANKLGWKFYDADDYHPIENKVKMSQGIPLSDEDRQPWLCELHELIKRERACGQRLVLACSALKRAYRRSLTTGGNLPKKRCQHKEDDISSETLFIHLQGSLELISKRMQKRKGHFMPLKLLESQFDTLEPPAAPELFITVNVEKAIPEIVSELQATLQDETPI
ncbi:probable gluconokinase isoform X1 [Pseudophryne corroboree]|uniref:probable gluconokinase isoform X1 n=1 Tax=Pseudophryne corroboree TaxID=495146 RepID=UPI003081D090